jgi:hypothetical protein
MPLQKIQLKPGVNRENTRYTNEGGYYESDNVRFRQGTPEKIGGWVRTSANTFLGVCRSLWNWVTLGYQNLIGVGTSLKFYVSNGGTYYDITPTQAVHTLTGPFTTNGTTTVTVTDAGGGYMNNSFVTFTGGTAVGGVLITGEYQISYSSGSTYTITVATAPSAATGGGTVYAVYQVNPGPSFAVPLIGWGAGAWGAGTWGNGSTSAAEALRIWNQFNFGEDLLYGPRDGPLYYWDATIGYLAATVTLTIATPCVVTATLILPDLTPIVFETSGALPTGLLVGTTYYTRYLSATTFLLSVAPGAASIAATCTTSSTLSGVIITSINGTFSCTASATTLVVGYRLTVSGTFGGTGSITGYVNPTTYFIISTNGSTGFTLSLTADGTAITTTVGTPTGLTYTLESALNVTAISGTLAAGYIVYVGSTSLGTLSFLGNGVGGIGTYAVSLPATLASTFMSVNAAAVTFIDTSGSQSGVHTISQRGVLLSALPTASDVPLSQIFFLVSDASRFVICFGTNDIGSSTVDPMLVRWSDQENPTMWTPAITNQSGSIGLSHGSTIVTAIQSKQEIVIFTDAAVYSLQYLGPPYVWGPQLLADNISLTGPNAVTLAAGTIYWMGVDKFYKYDGRLQTLSCDLLRYVYNDIDRTQFEQVYASTNEGFSEVWWFYPSNGSTTNDSYVVYNYLENIWYYGSMARTAWLDSGLQDYPLAATYSNNLVQHELGVDDGVTATLAPITAFITSSQFDIGDGHNFAFVWRMLPDLTFNGSTAGTTPSLTMQLLPLQNSGSGFNNPKSVGGDSSSAEGTVTATQTYPIDLDTYNGQLNIRVRARQMAMKISSNTLGTQWQLGAPRIDIRPDGRRGG